MVRTKQTAKESTGGKAPPLPRHLRNRDVLLRKGQYFTPAALKRTRRQFLLGRLYRFMVPFVRAKVITGLRRRWIYERAAHVQEVVPYPSETSTEVHGAHTIASMTRP